MWPRKNRFLSRVRLSLPVLVIAQEIIRVPVVHRGLQEQPSHPQMSHLLEAPVRRINPAPNNPEPFSLHLLAEHIVFGECHLLMKPAQLAKLLQLKQHEHARRKRMVQLRDVLEKIVARIEQLVHQAAVAAQNVRGHAMQLLALRQLDRPPNQRRFSKFDIRVEKKNVRAFRVRRSQISPDRGHSARNHPYIQPVAKTEHHVPRPVGGVRVSY